MKALKNFWIIIDWHTLAVMILAVGVTYLCHRYGMAANLPTGLIGIAIIFPIVFSINAAYRRREEALKNFASLKSHGVALFFAHRDWAPGGENDEHADRARRAVLDLLEGVKSYFAGNPVPGQSDRKLTEIYGRFSSFSRSMESLRSHKVSSGEISRANQYLRSMMIDFERMRNILAYRTPRTLRAYSQVFLNAFPILFGPYFAYLGQEYYIGVGYAVAILYTLVLVSLDNIQSNMENPFDQKGRDDLKLDVVSLYESVLR